MLFVSMPCCLSATRLVAPQSIRKRQCEPVIRKQVLKRPPLPNASPLPTKRISIAPAFLCQQMQTDAQSALRRILEGDIAALAARQIARDGEAEAEPSRVGVARRIQPMERTEDILALRRRNARPVIIDENIEAVARRDASH